jgi:hypothetical protein
LGCGCKATISEKDPRAEIWLYVFGKREFPLKHPLPVNTKPYGLMYEGDASALSEEQRERLIEKMIEKFRISRDEVTKVLAEGVVPIKIDGVTVSWCRKHSLAVL